MEIKQYFLEGPVHHWGNYGENVKFLTIKWKWNHRTLEYTQGLSKRDIHNYMSMLKTQKNLKFKKKKTQHDNALIVRVFVSVDT